MSDVLLNLAFFYQMSCNYNIIDNRNQDKGQLIRPLCWISHFLGRHRIRDRNVVVCLLLFRHVWCVCCLLRWGIELATSTMMENKRGTPLLCRDVSGRPLYSEWWQLMHAPAPVLWWDWGWWGAVPPPLACLWKYMGFEEERCLVARRWIPTGANSMLAGGAKGSFHVCVVIEVIQPAHANFRTPMSFAFSCSPLSIYWCRRARFS